MKGGTIIVVSIKPRFPWLAIKLMLNETEQKRKIAELPWHQTSQYKTLFSVLAMPVGIWIYILICISTWSDIFVYVFIVVFAVWQVVWWQWCEKWPGAIMEPDNNYSSIIINLLHSLCALPFSDCHHQVQHSLETLVHYSMCTDMTIWPFRFCALRYLSHIQTLKLYIKFVKEGAGIPQKDLI